MSFAGAFIAGLLSFLSPCVLPLVPPYLCFLAGVSFSELSNQETSNQEAPNQKSPNQKAPNQKAGSAGANGTIFATAVAFVLGFTTVFVALGATASVIGQVVTEHLQTLSVIAGLAIAIMGLHFLGLLRLSWLYGSRTIEVKTKPPGLLGGYVVGLAFAFGWTPCVGPVLAAILFMAGSQETVWSGAGLLAVYSLGIGLPFLAAAAFVGTFLHAVKHLRSRMWVVEKAMGGLLVLTGVLFMTGQMSNMAFWLLNAFPSLGSLG
ncbi:MAG: cytochrome c biogenesis CcdA family protein [Pseudomonadota bacterium]